jgi:hypothetical protein
MALPHQQQAASEERRAMNEAITGIPLTAESEASPRPAEICRYLLQAMDATEGRRKRRKRNTTPDALGLEIMRELLEAAVAADPESDAFEEWLFAQVQTAGALTGATRAMALQVRDDWAFALASGGFRDWLAAGAPSDDTRPGPDMGLDRR